MSRRISENDVRTLQRAIDTLRSETRNPRNRPVVIPDEITTPEVYLAIAPDGGIPGTIGEASGWRVSLTGLSSIHGPILPLLGGESGGPPATVPNAECNIYRLLNGVLTLTGLKRIVYNTTGSDILPASLFLAIRDKFGTWFAATPGTGGSVTPEGPEVYLARTPIAGIPGLADISLTSPIATISSTICDIYTISSNKVVSAGPTERVYNYNVQPIAGDTVVVVVKDEYGNWFAIPPVNPLITIVGLDGSGTAGPITIPDVYQLQFDQADGYVVSEVTQGIARLDFTGTGEFTLAVSPVTAGVEGTVISPITKIQFDLDPGGSLTDEGGGVARYTPPEFNNEVPYDTHSYYNTADSSYFLHTSGSGPFENIGIYPCAIVNGNWTRTVQPPANTGWALPFIIAKHRTDYLINFIGIWLETAGSTGCKCRIGIYKSYGFPSAPLVQPHDLMYDTGEIALDAGDGSIVSVDTGGLLLSGGNIYWAAIEFSEVSTMPIVGAVDLDHVYPVYGTTLELWSPTFGEWNGEDFVYGAWPAVGPWSASGGTIQPIKADMGYIPVAMFFLGLAP